MKHLLLLVFLFTAITIQAQKKISPVKYASSITADDLKKHLFIIASAEMEGRETATEGQRKAAAYIEDHFRKLGLVAPVSGGYQQYYPVYTDTLLDAKVAVNDVWFNWGKDVSGSLSSLNTQELNFGEFLFLAKGDSTTNITGKAVILVLPKTSTRISNAEMMSLLTRSPSLVLAISSGTLPGNGSRMGNMYLNPFRATQSPTLLYATEAIGKAIMNKDLEAAQKNELSTKKYLTKFSSIIKKEIKTLRSSNVMGLLEGTDKKDEYVVISSHYDHIGKQGAVINFGADDDGSGTVGVLELAEAFSMAKLEGKGPRRSILFLTVSGEEKGLWGSEYYANNPIFPLDKTTVDLNIDMIGRIGTDYLSDKDSANYIYVIGDDKISSDLMPISDEANTKYTKIKLDKKYNDISDPNRFYYRSDHYNFAIKGVPIIFYFNGVHKDYHRPTDTPDKINYPLMAKRTQLVFYTALEMANKEELLKRDIPLQIPPRR